VFISNEKVIGLQTLTEIYMFDASVIGLHPNELPQIGEAIQAARQERSDVAPFACDIGNYELRLEHISYDRYL
jgi:hypothetical protein